MADPHHVSDAYVRGSQEIREQESTFEAFMGLTKWGSLILAALLVFLTLWFQPGGSFVSGLITAGVLAVAGFFFLKSGKKH
ncbi:MAG: aa3-type cytochrome c oxidase subunit IV [Brevundimonas sp.]|uniref:aa3-type cytochrome c oxidase subunit IV n=1 Tax=Brevundimonas sp. TaxID=1871086 RepID=UPI002717F775|nr:aa3-type cytochrome c oxidase subunit IV [Brevundimonas sp.]MDO9587259.1 aa3-type cytochrome c oxidase subunit IV [Brevundimonas sp.]MDP3369153.1 aa3-type cytochrome c oxidase subunit IV [Brevundimonas sp.]MDP3655794.1 aa3-type cytochrome c oxidase subunit IV [Brevundimonas sp.]MDZ4109318.1 aa3-type cytochrome c oxidase subunit IV [Brevundimonas sp.]